VENRWDKKEEGGGNQRDRQNKCPIVEGGGARRGDPNFKQKITIKMGKKILVGKEIVG